MEKRLIVFLLLSLAILQGYSLLLNWWNPPPQPPAVAEGDRAAEDQPKIGPAEGADQPAEPGGADAEPKPAEDDAEQPAEAGADPEVGQKTHPEQWVTLGSLDPTGPYRLLVTLTNRGAALSRAEFSSLNFRDLEDRSGYLGHLEAIGDPDGRGCLVQVVGPGTPAAAAGLQPGDVIFKLNNRKVSGRVSLEEALQSTRPGDTVELGVLRAGAAQQLAAKLVRRPLEVIRPEDPGHLSMLTTLTRIDELELEADEIDLDGVDLWQGNWEIVGQPTQSEVRFRRRARGLEITKTYRLAEVVPGKEAESPGYGLTFDIEIRNADASKHSVAYRLDGPNGLPDEGWWYATRIGRELFGGAGVRDIVVGLWEAGRLNYWGVVTARTIAADKVGSPWRDQPIVYLGVDAQYFAAVLIPQVAQPGDVWFESAQPIRVGPVPDQKWQWNRTNTSFRVQSTVHDLAPGEALQQGFTLFAGPKQPDVLSAYRVGGDYTLGDRDVLVYFGWFGWVSRPMLVVLHFFHDYITFGNYGLAIILLTVVVRLCMFPLSRKQALGAQKMQLLQPELKKIQEKYKGNTEAKTKATQELFAKHKYNPLGGCLLVFVQLPIFMGLYRSLAVDVELRQAPLLGANIPWASNLAAPDMLFNWSGFMPEFIQGYLGPYFNILPVVTIALFLWQQKMFMPPPTDEQTRMQMRLMQYMMVFMGVMFFKVPSGLCIYFIASSLWGIAERKLLPRTMKSTTPTAASDKTAPYAAKAASNGAGDKRSARRGKQRGRR